MHFTQKLTLTKSFILPSITQYTAIKQQKKEDMKSPTVLVILDGFGISDQKNNNAVAAAHTPNLSQWLQDYPHAMLAASGKAVGLPPHFQGNSQVGHMTIGAGRIVAQPLTIWNNAIQDNSFFDNLTLQQTLFSLKKTQKTLHIMGLLSNAGVHSHSNHLKALLKAAQQYELKKIVIHAFLDGRDAPPQSASIFLQEIENFTSNMPNVVLGSIQGRFFAMDRDHHWDRTQQSYDMLTTQQQNTHDTSWHNVLQKNYAHTLYDEFIPPTLLKHDAIINNGDSIIFFNIRPDRARQLTACFIVPETVPFPTKKLNLAFFITPFLCNDNPSKFCSASLKLHRTKRSRATMTLFPLPIITNTLKDVLCAHNKTIFSIAETEKYAHITYFFDGRNEATKKTETRVLIPSLRVQSYKNYPEMAAPAITDAVIQSLKTNPCDFYLINYANADMVGHTGNLNATIKAIECLDAQLKKIYDALVTQMNGTLFITADHGKAETMFDDTTHQPHTAHTTNVVPFIMVSNKKESSGIQLSLTQLCDIAPFILHTMHLPVPKEMTHKQCV